MVGEDDAGEDIVFVFDDVAEVWQGVKNEKFEAYRKRASWVWKCLYWTEEMYGYTPIENFLDVIRDLQSVSVGPAVDGQDWRFFSFHGF